MWKYSRWWGRPCAISQTSDHFAGITIWEPISRITDKGNSRIDNKPICWYVTFNLTCYNIKIGIVISYWFYFTILSNRIYIFHLFHLAIVRFFHVPHSNTISILNRLSWSCTWKSSFNRTDHFADRYFTWHFHDFKRDKDY